MGGELAFVFVYSGWSMQVCAFTHFKVLTKTLAWMSLQKSWRTTGKTLLKRSTMHIFFMYWFPFPTVKSSPVHPCHQCFSAMCQQESVHIFLNSEDPLGQAAGVGHDFWGQLISKYPKTCFVMPSPSEAAAFSQLAAERVLRHRTSNQQEWRVELALLYAVILRVCLRHTHSHLLTWARVSFGAKDRGPPPPHKRLVSYILQLCVKI